MQPIHSVLEVKADSSVDLLLKAQSGNDDALNRLLLPSLERQNIVTILEQQEQTWKGIRRR